MIPTARKCSQCKRPHPIERLTKLADRELCPNCIIGENIQPRRKAETVKSKPKKVFQFTCSCCNKKIPYNLEQKIEEDGQTYILCPRCYNFRMNILTTIRRINNNERERNMHNNNGS